MSSSRSSNRWIRGGAMVWLYIIASCCAATLVAGSMAAVVPDEGAATDAPPSAAADETDNDQDHSRKVAEDAQHPPRVIVRAGRNEEVMGYLKLHDESVIVVETLRGEIKSFPALRVLDIVHLVDPEPGQRGMVLLKDGQSREGIIIEDTFEHVIIDVQNIRSRLPREHVDRVILKPTFQEQYEQFLSTLDPALPQRTVLFCRWLMDQRRYDLARDHLRALLDSEDAPRDISEPLHLLRVAEAQLALQRSDGSANAENADDASTLLTDEPTADAEEFPGGLLTRDDVNLIRVYEIDFKRPPRVSVKPETIRELVSKYSTHPSMPASESERNAMFRADAIDVVKLMFELRAREMYGQVRVHTEPHSLNIFRQRVHNNWLLHNCASCHNSSTPETAGRFMLHRRGYQDDRVRYTNFLILERLEIDPQWPLINYNEPEMSLIIQHAMPRNEARLPHPDVKGWEPVFTRVRERLKRASIQWIESMMQPRPQYPIDYVPPTADRTVEAARNDEKPGEGDEQSQQARRDR